jgi:hypothetical protein
MANTERKNKPSTKEIAEFSEKEKKAAWAKQVSDALRLVDLENLPNKTYTVYNKESLRTYLKNPLSDNNAKNLRKLSQFLYVLSPQYRRIIAYFASMIDLTAYSVIPNISMTEDNDDEKILQNYEGTLRWLERMNLPGQIYSIAVNNFREDLFAGYSYYDESDEHDVNSFVIVPLDLDYVRISSVNFDGTLNVAFDMSFFDNSSNAVYLEIWDSAFQKMYNSYKKDSKLRWQELDPERTWVFKFNYDQNDRVIPPFAGIFENLIDILDLQSITSLKDEMSIYKLLVAKINHISGSDEVNDFEVDLNTAVDFFNKMVATLPEYVGAILSPMEITPVTFDKHATDDTNQISKANSNLWEAAGVSQILDNDKLTGASAVRAAQILDGLYAHNPLLWQIEARVNRFIDFVMPDNGMRVKYMRVTPYNKSEKITELKDAASLGLPVKTQYMSLLGVSPMDGYSLSYLENNVLKLQDNWKYPLQSSYTQPGDEEGGGQEKEILTDEGEKTKDQEKNKK